MEKEINLQHYKQEIIRQMSTYNEDFIDRLNERFDFYGYPKGTRLTKYEKAVCFVMWLLEEYGNPIELTQVEKFILENTNGTTITKHGYKIVIEGYNHYNVKKSDEETVEESERYTLDNITDYFEDAYFDGLENDKTYFIEEILENCEVVEYD